MKTSTEQSTAFEVTQLKTALRQCLRVIKIQINRDCGLFRISAEAFEPLWTAALIEGEMVLGETTDISNST